MLVLPYARLRTGILLLACLAASAAAPRVDAAPIVIRFDATLTDASLGINASDTNVDVAPGAEITLGNGSNVGSYFFDDEFVDASSNGALSLLRYGIQGGGGAHPSDSDYSLTGWGALSTLAFSNFELDVPGALTGVTLTVDAAGGRPRIIGQGGGALVSGVDYLFSPLEQSLTVYLEGLGVLNVAGGLPLGIMSFTLALEADDPQLPPSPIPEPASLVLVASGIAIAARARRARTKSQSHS